MKLDINIFIQYIRGLVEKIGRPTTAILCPFSFNISQGVKQLQDKYTPCGEQKEKILKIEHFV